MQLSKLCCITSQQRAIECLTALDCAAWRAAAAGVAPAAAPPARWLRALARRAAALRGWWDAGQETGRSEEEEDDF